MIVILEVILIISYFKGIDALDIPNRRIGKTATALVKKLCRDNPGERLGSGSGGVNDIRKHRYVLLLTLIKSRRSTEFFRWFMGFDWCVLCYNFKR